jgi:hypothetical protein
MKGDPHGLEELTCAMGRAGDGGAREPGAPDTLGGTSAVAAIASRL